MTDIPTTTDTLAMTDTSIMPIVFVNAVVPPAPEHVHKYLVLRDKSCCEVMRIARENQGVWIFVFATKTAEACPDYRYLGRVARRDARYRLVVQPMYVGNLSPVEDAISEIVDRVLGGAPREEVTMYPDLGTRPLGARKPGSL